MPQNSSRIIRRDARDDDVRLLVQTCTNRRSSRMEPVARSCRLTASTWSTGRIRTKRRGNNEVARQTPSPENQIVSRVFGRDIFRFTGSLAAVVPSLDVPPRSARMRRKCVYTPNEPGVAARVRASLDNDAGQRVEADRMGEPR